MTCFWDGLRQSLNLHRISNTDFVHALQQYNTMKLPTDVQWNGQYLGLQVLTENYNHIRSYKTETMSTGYDCSVCDPFLVLCTVLFKKNIVHTYNTTRIEYLLNPEYETLEFKSNMTHFEYVRRIHYENTISSTCSWGLPDSRLKK